MKPTWEPKQWVGEKNNKMPHKPNRNSHSKSPTGPTDATAASKTFTGKPKGSRGWKRKERGARLPLLGTPGDLSIDCYRLIDWTSVSPPSRCGGFSLLAPPDGWSWNSFCPATLIHCHTPHTPNPPSQVPSSASKGPPHRFGTRPRKSNQDQRYCSSWYYSVLFNII